MFLFRWYDDYIVKSNRSVSLAHSLSDKSFTKRSSYTFFISLECCYLVYTSYIFFFFFGATKYD
ncbi:hypothetical protein OAV88_01925 [bacterium]|nr:hypothetical protein [bacterium]